MNTGDKRAILTKNPNTLPLVLTPSDIADILALSRNTTYELIHSETFPAFRVGKQYRVSKDKFLAWLDEADKNNNVA